LKDPGTIPAKTLSIIEKNSKDILCKNRFRKHKSYDLFHLNEEDDNKPKWEGNATARE